MDTKTINIFLVYLENDKYYICSSVKYNIDIKKQYKNSIKWVQTNRPLNILKIYYDCNYNEIDDYTVIYMNKYGIDNVRGGNFTKYILFDDDYIKIANHTKNLIKKNKDKFYKIFNETDIFTCNYCKKNIDNEKAKEYHENYFCDIRKNNLMLEKDKPCFRCKRYGHSSYYCYVKTDIDGNEINF